MASIGDFVSTKLYEFRGCASTTITTNSSYTTFFKTTTHTTIPFFNNITATSSVTVVFQKAANASSPFIVDQGRVRTSLHSQIFYSAIYISAFLFNLSINSQFAHTDLRLSKQLEGWTENLRMELCIEHLNLHRDELN